MAAKRPSFQFYSGDWLKDPSVRALSLAARGLWMDMICLMDQSARRGYLELNGQPVSAEQLARMTGCFEEQVTPLLRELEYVGVHSTTDAGVIFNRRMVKDEQARASAAKRQQKVRDRGGGDPERWTAIRAVILNRDGKICAYCGRRAQTVDHLLPKSKGGDERNSNLVSCCKSCNSKKGARTMKEAGMSFWPGFDCSKLESDSLVAPESQRSSSSSSSSTSVKKDIYRGDDLISETERELAARERPPPGEDPLVNQAPQAVQEAFARLLSIPWWKISALDRMKIAEKTVKHGEANMLAGIEECMKNDKDRNITAAVTAASTRAIQAGKKAGGIGEGADSKARPRYATDEWTRKLSGG